MTFTVEFIGDLSNQSVSMSIDASGLTAPATTINVVETQAGAADIPSGSATNIITFGSLVENGNFSLQHPNINSNTPIEISVNDVDVRMDDVTTGVAPVNGPAATFKMHLSSAPSSNFEWLVYEGDTDNPLTIDHLGTDIVFHGGEYGSIQAALNAHFGTGVWTVTGNPADAGDIIFTGPSTTFGSSPWVITQDDWADVGVTTTPSFSDGYPGIRQQYVLTLGGVPSSGNLWLNYGDYAFIISFDGTNVVINGNPFSSIQGALDLINGGSYGYAGPWTCSDSPTSGTTITIYGPQSSIGLSPWSINSDGWDVEVSDAWTDGAPHSDGTQAVHSLVLDGAFAGTFELNSFSGIPWNIDTGTLSDFWTANVATVSSITGNGAHGNPWVITYTALAPQDLPVITSSALVGFTSTYLQSQIGGGYFTVTGTTNPYTLTSVGLGSGQTAVTAANVDMVAGVDVSDQPTVATAGIAPIAGNDGVVTWDFSPDIGQVKSITINTGSGSVQASLETVGDDGVDQSNWQVEFNVFYSGKTSVSVSSHILTVTLVGPLADTPITSASSTGTNQPTIFTVGNAAVSGVQCVMHVALHGATGGTFNINGDAENVGPIPYNEDNSDLLTNWETATGKTVSITGSGTDGDPWIITYSETAPEDVPYINGSNLTKAGTINNDFTDGTVDSGQDEIQTISLADSPTGGTWTATFGSDTTDPLVCNIAASDLQTALRSAWGISTILVTGTAPYSIDFGVHSSQGSITADGSLLTQGVTPNVVEIQKGQTLN